MTIRIPIFENLEYLVRRKFRNYKELQSPPDLGGSGITPDRRAESLAEIEAYKGELMKLPDEELTKLVEAEREKEVVARTARVNREEQGRFFNEPSSRADLTHWAKMTYWTLEEAIALSFGKSPEVVNWEKLKKYENVSSFVAEYAKVRDLAIRAKNGKQFYDPVNPGVFLAWAKRNDIDYPRELEELVTKYGQNFGDWKTAYDNLKVNFDELKMQFEELVEDRDALLERTKELSADGKPLNPKERESVSKMIIGMAIGGYAHNPSAARSPTSKDIADDLAKVGLSINADTVRKWLKEAAGLLPKDTNID